MAADGYADGDEQLQVARAAALAQRPAAVLPQAVAWRVDDAPFRRAAAESYAQAQVLYAAGRAREGDLCLTRGDLCAQAALLHAHANVAGAAPKLPAEPADHDPDADPPSRARLQAKLLDAQRQASLQIQLPVVQFAATDSGGCDGLYYIAWGHALLASDSFGGGDDLLGWYHVHEAQQYLIDWEACELAASLP